MCKCVNVFKSGPVFKLLLKNVNEIYNNIYSSTKKHKDSSKKELKQAIRMKCEIIQ